MKHEILDEIENKNIENKNSIIRVIQISIGTLILYLILEKIRMYLPENLVNWEGVKIKTVGLIIIGIVSFNAIILPTYLNKIEPTLNEIKIIFYTGFTIFTTEFLYKLMQNFFLMDNGWDLYYLQIIKIAAIYGGIGMLISNIRIHKIRKKKTLIPVLLLIGIWVLLGIILKE